MNRKLLDYLGIALLFVGLYFVGIGISLFQYDPRFSFIIATKSQAFVVGILAIIVSFALNPRLKKMIKI